ncbi:glycosyltransferase family 4 protein [Chromobacterium sphagni]|uniref:glycosyltransferase family 4 protein n=1 Tax=Chromobacterium sphagni TaxID=1903179 RepID=UPI001113E731|nr:glycosyltransferase family 4 protein [Chromobacterium sphagni]
MASIPSAIASPRGKILLFSYAFPPMQVQMTPAVFKPMAAIAQQGYSVDVLCADSFCPELPLDNSLLPHSEETFSNITRLSPPRDAISWLQRKSRVFSRMPDLMTVLHRSAYSHLMDLDLSDYDAVMTWSPFHSINPVMVRVKKARKNVRWIAQFSDPWAGNPLEVSRLTKMWNRRHEPETVDAADYIVHSSAYSLDIMLSGHSPELRKKTDVLPHVFNTDLYPKRPKAKNEKIVLRYVGVLYGRRTPEPVFAALNMLFSRRKDLRELLVVELIGQVSKEMLESESAYALPTGMVRNIPNVSYLQSLELMYDADILLLIEADVRQNLFLPSKISDYIGANTPIVGLVPPGASEDAMVGLGGWHSPPSDVIAISNSIENAVDHVMNKNDASWFDSIFRQKFDGAHVAQRFIEIAERIKLS